MIQNRELRLVLMGKSILIDVDQEEYIMPREKLDYIHLKRIDVYRHLIEIKFCDVKLEITVRDWDHTDPDQDVWSMVNFFREALGMHDDAQCDLCMCPDKHGVREDGEVTSNAIEETH